MDKTKIILGIIGLIIGIAIVCGALYYLIKERHDPQSKKIYGVMLAIGGVITIAMILKLILS